ncbi:hypothetical protein P154DRAFT_349804 [Amniculicola lignicola CBS 123094]|uniref:Mid2 domain-containing protein n=1 Tax=Amniculicola lignicola CBS 123094 TaxID=1392246 RepID=A0A6A5W562_9PLEO|nr:hypothetical protein P154DRAFT_349804 [Amniculicola lignicola CBS 123094]
MGISPAPTPAPRRRDVARLLGRQESQAPDICGFENQEYTDSVTCAVTSRTCYFNTKSEWFGCCTDSACSTEINLLCVPSSSASALNTATGRLLCTFGTMTECYTYINIWSSFGATFTNYQCSDTAFADTIYFEATNSPSSINSPTPSTPSTPSPIPTSSSSSSSTPAPSTTSTPSPSPTPPPKKDDKLAPVGAIVGGVAGGVALLSIIAFGVFFIMCRNKKKSTPGPAPGTAPQGQLEFTTPPQGICQHT